MSPSAPKRGLGPFLPNNGRFPFLSLVWKTAVAHNRQMPVVQGTAQNNISDPTMQIVVGEVVSSLILGYAVLCLLLFFIGLILFVYNHSKGHKAKQAQVAAAAN